MNSKQITDLITSLLNNPSDLTVALISSPLILASREGKTITNQNVIDAVSNYLED